jgi:hypothetical protein
VCLAGYALLGLNTGAPRSENFNFAWFLNITALKMIVLPSTVWKTELGQEAFGGV